MSYMHISTAFVLYVAFNSFSAAENIARNEFDQVKNVMKMLQEKVKTQEARIIDLEKEIEALKNGDEGSSKRAMTESRRQDEKEKQPPPHSYNHQKGKMIDMQDNVNQEKLGIRTVPAPTECMIAFYAYMSTTETYPGTHHTIIYDNEVTNIGNGYNRLSGIFTAPVDGVYVFSWTIFMGHPGEYKTIELMLNSRRVGASYVYDLNAYSSVSGTAVLSMQKNDIVFTRTFATFPPHGAILIDYLMRSAFTGWCLSCH
ncbi:complement C1q tumor necrosis factor-related protein 3-like [Crassostrea angulata]|uniref:complement C1q tumor necrosis factor-related protein 3-like n=1 Tax=Magallana angulata TaxID=2784310 RepID=UPI0022B18444|nr:complement C1q tumor necrosis factor-related protein 3-like [Crassostrea angulata]